MDKTQLIILLFSVAVAILAAGIIMVSIAYYRLKKAQREKGEYPDDVKIRKGVRYSTDEAAFTDGKENVRLTQKDFVLARGVVYVVEKGGELMPGVYTVLKSLDAVGEFKIRVAGYVRTYKHGDKVVLHDGDEVEATSSDVILA